MTEFRIPAKAQARIDAEARRDQRLEWDGKVAVYSGPEQVWLLENFVEPALDLPRGDSKRAELAHELCVMHAMKADLGVDLVRDDVSHRFSHNDEGGTEVPPSRVDDAALFD